MPAGRRRGSQLELRRFTVRHSDLWIFSDVDPEQGTANCIYKITWYGPGSHGSSAVNRAATTSVSIETKRDRKRSVTLRSQDWCI